MMSRANPVGRNALPPKVAASPVATKLKDDVASAGISSLVKDNNKMLAGKMSQTKTSENVGAPFLATQTVAAAPAASKFNIRRRTKLSPRVFPGGATGVAGRTNLAVRPSGLGKKTKTQLRSVPLRAGPGKVNGLFRKAPAPTY